MLVVNLASTYVYTLCILRSIRFMMLIVVVQFLEVQELGYNGFAWASYEDLVLFTSTPKALCFLLFK